MQGKFWGLGALHSTLGLRQRTTYQAGRSMVVPSANFRGSQSLEGKSQLSSHPSSATQVQSHVVGKTNRVFDKPHVKKTGSEGIAGPDVLKLLGHLRWGSVQLFRDVLLFVGLHGVELLTQVSINHILGHGKMRAKEKGQVPKENDTHKAAAARKALYSPTKTFTPRAEPGTLP